MPRGNPNIWKAYGPSYSQLSQLSKASEREPTSAAKATTCSMPAGAPAVRDPKGPGMFQLQSTWSLGAPEVYGSTISSSETKVEFAPPPKDHKRREALRTDKSHRPTGTYLNDYKTTKQLDYTSQRHLDGERRPPFSLKDNGKIIPADVQPDYSTQARTSHVGSIRSETLPIRTAGHPATSNSGYNIITGGAPLQNNAFEHWNGRDYRRHV